MVLAIIGFVVFFCWFWGWALSAMFFKTVFGEDLVLWVMVFCYVMPYIYVIDGIRHLLRVEWYRIYYDVWEMQVCEVNMQYSLYYEYVWGGWHELEARVFWFLSWRILFLGF